MHPWHQRDMVMWMRELATKIETQAEKLEKREPDELRWAAGWGSESIQFQDRPLTADQTRHMAANAIWALFEQIRDAGNPGDPVAFAEVMASVTAEASKRCHQRPAAAQVSRNAGEP